MSTNMPASARYEEIRDCGSGAFGVCKLMRDKVTGEMVAVKFMERGEKIDHNVEREIVNHKTLLHPQVIQFKEVFLTQSHLAIALEYASGGELFDTVARAGRLSENDARYFFQQIVVGLEYCHSRGVCHRDLKLENILLDGSPKRRLKICDFGYSKNLFNSAPKSTVGTVAYIAPEVLTCRKDSAQYRGQAADVWSCGVILYVMLVGSYPFEDPADPRNMRKTVEKILDVKYSLPRSLSSSCRDLLKNIFVRDPNARITIPAIKAHPWFQHALPPELQYQGIKEAQAQIKISHQSDEEIKAIIEGAHKRAGEVAPKAAVEEKPEWTNGKEPLEQFSSLDSDFIDDDIESYMMASGIDKSLLYSDDSGIPPQ